MDPHFQQPDLPFRCPPREGVGAAAPAAAVQRSPGPWQPPTLSWGDSSTPMATRQGPAWLHSPSTASVESTPSEASPGLGSGGLLWPWLTPPPQHIERPWTAKTQGANAPHESPAGMSECDLSGDVEAGQSLPHLLDSSTTLQFGKTRPMRVGLSLPERLAWARDIAISTALRAVAAATAVASSWAQPSPDKLPEVDPTTPLKLANKPRQASTPVLPLHADPMQQLPRKSGPVVHQSSAGSLSLAGPFKASTAPPHGLQPAAVGPRSHRTLQHPPLLPAVPAQSASPEDAVARKGPPRAYPGMRRKQPAP